MRIIQYAPMRLAFLLVDDNLQGAAGAGVTTEISVNGQPFQPTKHLAQEIGDGWYTVDLDADETAIVGPLVFRANGDTAAHEWRDIHQVEEPLAAVDAAALQEIVRQEIEQWAVQIAVPVKLIRLGANG